MDLIYLWVGKVVVWLIAGILMASIIIVGGWYFAGLVYILWHKIKRFIPRWQWEQSFVDEWRRVSAKAEPHDWRSKVTITQKGRFVIWRCPECKFGFRTEYALVKR